MHGKIKSIGMEIRESKERADVEEVFRKLNLIFKFADFNYPILEKATEMNWKDFEDAVQSATAEQIHADYIVTRNVRDFAKSKVVAFTPAELLARI